MSRRILIAVGAVVLLLVVAVTAVLLHDMTDLMVSDGPGAAGSGSLPERLERIANRSVTQLTHFGRSSGKAYDVTTWFAVDGETVYIPTSDRGRQWARNVLATPRIALRMGEERFAGSIAPVEDDAEKHRIYELLRDKYAIIWLLGTGAVLSGNDPAERPLDLGRGGFYRVRITPDS
jgi:deazaflavin-dependent oxidoreductase (nitroreductase family)